MSLSELDPVFVKALRLLQSRSKDSAEPLRQLYNEVVAGRKRASPKNSTVKPSGNQGDSEVNDAAAAPKFSSSSTFSLPEAKENQTEASTNIVKKDATYTAKGLLPKTKPEVTDDGSQVVKQEKKRDAEKRNLDKLKLDLKELNQEAEESPTKKPKLDIPASLSESKDADGEESTDAGYFAMEMGVACIVCRQIDFSPNNQLAECQECHSLYHQACHKPVLTDQEVNDPRNIWYCNRCAKNLKKITKSSGKESSGSNRDTVNTSPPHGSNISKQSGTGSKSAKSEILQAFKRTEIKEKSSHTGNNSGAPLQGLAALAANLGGKSTKGLASLGTKSNKPVGTCLKMSSSTSCLPSLAKSDGRNLASGEKATKTSEPSLKTVSSSSSLTKLNKSFAEKANSSSSLSKPGSSKPSSSSSSRTGTSSNAKTKDGSSSSSGSSSGSKSTKDGSSSSSGSSSGSKSTKDGNTSSKQSKDSHSKSSRDSSLSSTKSSKDSTTSSEAHPKGSKTARESSTSKSEKEVGKSGDSSSSKTKGGDASSAATKTTKGDDTTSAATKASKGGDAASSAKKVTKGSDASVKKDSSSSSSKAHKESSSKSSSKEGSEKSHSTASSSSKSDSHTRSDSKSVEKKHSKPKVKPEEKTKSK